MLFKPLNYIAPHGIGEFMTGVCFPDEHQLCGVCGVCSDCPTIYPVPETACPAIRAIHQIRSVPGHWLE